MDPSLHSVITSISASLAPAVLVTGLGLLLAGLQTKYSTLVNVLRQLSGEVRQNCMEDAQAACDRQEVLLAFCWRHSHQPVCANRNHHNLHAGLDFVLWSLVNVFLDSTRSLDAIADELDGLFPLS